MQPLASARDADIGQAPLLLELLGVRELTQMRDGAVLKTGDEDDRELQALGGVQGHQRDHSPGIGLRVGDLVGVSDQRHLLKEVFEAGWLTFAFGATQPGAAQWLTALWALPLLVLVAIRFTERTLRGELFRSLAETWGAPGAWALTLLCGTALALPAIAPGFDFGAPLAVAAGLATALGREIGATVLYRASGLVAAGVYRGTLIFAEVFLVADWLQPVLVSATYGTGAGTYLLLRAAAPLLAALLLARALRVAVPKPTDGGAKGRAGTGTALAL